MRILVIIVASIVALVKSRSGDPVHGEREMAIVRGECTNELGKAVTRTLADPDVPTALEAADEPLATPPMLKNLGKHKSKDIIRKKSARKSPQRKNRGSSNPWEAWIVGLCTILFGGTSLYLAFSYKWAIFTPILLLLGLAWHKMTVEKKAAKPSLPLQIAEWSALFWILVLAALDIAKLAFIDGDSNHTEFFVTLCSTLLRLVVPALWVAAKATRSRKLKLTSLVATALVIEALGCLVFYLGLVLFLLFSFTDVIKYNREISRMWEQLKDPSVIYVGITTALFLSATYLYKHSLVLGRAPKKAGGSWSAALFCIVAVATIACLVCSIPVLMTFPAPSEDVTGENFLSWVLSSVKNDSEGVLYLAPKKFTAD